MPLQFSTDMGTLVIPSAPASWTTAPSNSGLSTNGVVVLVGESDIGPDFTAESDITQNYFGPTQFAAVQAKYGSGHLVDAFREITTPSLDPQVTGGPGSTYIIKTNKGVQASGALDGYGVIQAKSEGSLGNLISFQAVELVEQVAPSVSAAYVLDALTETINVSADGAVPYALPTTPGYSNPSLAAVGLLNYLLVGVNQSFAQDIIVSGGTQYQPTAAVVGNISLAASGFQAIISLASATWSTFPVVGQTLIIPSGSTLQGAGSANDGFYIVVGTTLNTVTALKVKNLSGSAPTAPVAVAPVAVSGTDFQVFDPITFTSGKGKKHTDQTGISTWSGAVSGSNFVITLTTPLQTWAATPDAGDLCKFQRGGSYWWFNVISTTSNSATLQQIAPTTTVSAIAGFASEAVGSSTIEFIDPIIDGVGQSLLFQRAATSTGQQFYNAAGVPAPISTTGAIYTSAAERKVAINVNRAATNTSESWSAGGNVVITIGKDDTVHQPISIVSDVLTLGTYGTIPLAQFKTIGDLANFINSIPLWHAVANPAFKQANPALVIDHVVAVSPGSEDEVSATNQNLIGAMPCRLKKDAYDMITSLNNSQVVQFPLPPDTLGGPLAGLPDPDAIPGLAFLSGGTKGGTADSDVEAALAAAGLVQGNFVVTLFSQDAVQDIASGDTDPASSYDIASINAALSAHVSQYSQFKIRKPRQGFASFRGSYADSKLAAQTISNARMCMNFLDVNTLGANGLQWFQPWMGAVTEAGMQSAAFYKPVFNKSIDISGVRSNYGDFSPSNDSQVEDALLNGLTVIRPRIGGGFSFVSDNTTYGVDSNFVFNSVQAIYVADLVAQTTGQRIEQAFVGQSFADVSPTIVVSYMKNIMASLKALKLISASDDAPSGVKNIVVNIQAPAILISAEVKLSTGVYFAPIQFLVTQVQGTAQA